MGVIRHILTCLTLCLVIAGAFGAAPASAARPPRVERGTSIPIAGGGDLAFSGTRVLWQETSATGTARVNGLDLTTRRPLPLPPARGSQSQPALSGTLAAWIERDPLTERPQLVVYDLDVQRRLAITGPEALPSHPAIDGTMVVWRDQRSGAWAIYGYDLVAAREFLIADGAGNHGPPAISGKTVVWSAFREGTWDIQAYDLTERRPRALADGPGDQINPRLSANRVVYVHLPEAGGPPSLIVRELTSDRATTLTDKHLVAAPAIAGDLVVWEDWRDGMAGVFAYDLAERQEIPITRAEQVRSPLVDGRSVVWLNVNPFGTQIAIGSLIATLPSERREAPLRADPNVIYFPETGHAVAYGFKTFWQQHGGLATFGYPLTEEFSMTDPATGRRRTVQYFERFRLEHDPEESDPAKQVTVSRLGAEWLAGRGIQPLPPIADSDYRRYFPETGHTLSHGFKEYWDTHNGLTLLGFPISEEMEENGRIVQYFERGRLEADRSIVDPDQRIGPGQLGRDMLVARGWLPGGERPSDVPPLPAR